jgi:hypothetical protein
VHCRGANIVILNWQRPLWEGDPEVVKRSGRDEPMKDWRTRVQGRGGGGGGGVATDNVYNPHVSKCINNKMK